FLSFVSSYRLSDSDKENQDFVDFLEIDEGRLINEVDLIGDDNLEFKARVSSRFYNKIFEINNVEYIERDGEIYGLASLEEVDFDPHLSSELCIGGGINEKIDVTVSGDLPLTSLGQILCLMGGGAYFNIRIRIMEDDWSSPDDLIRSEYLTIHRVCWDEDDLFLPFSVTFNDVDFSSEFGGAEGDTIEVYAIVTPEDNGDDLTIARSTQSYDIDQNDNCDCISGPCCNVGSHTFDSYGSQPEGYSDSYICSDENSPTGTNYVIKRDFYCNGIDPNSHYSESNVDVCGTCEYCTYGDSTCNYYSSSTPCGTRDCDSQDTTCRNYHDVNNLCNRGSCSTSNCVDYTNAPRGTPCGTNKECDGNGYCADEVVGCYNDNDCLDDYWLSRSCYYGDVWGDFKDYYCENPGQPGSECSWEIIWRQREECGTSGYSGSNYCYDNDVYRDYIERGCDGAYCYEYSQRRKQEECGYDGCENGQCEDYVECYSDEDCGIDGYVGNLFCQNNDVYQKWREYDCSNPGTPESECSYLDSNLKIEECGLNDCEDGECIDSLKPDLTVRDLVIQSIDGRDVVLGFTIKNIGDSGADSVYWIVDSDSGDENPERLNSVSLDSGDWIRAFMMLHYSSSGTYRPVVIVDHDDYIQESNENNNEESISVRV
ncbi:CARDB domain-containing protein, partial [Nanoarchaeota archaeon]